MCLGGIDIEFDTMLVVVVVVIVIVLDRIFYYTQSRTRENLTLSNAFYTSLHANIIFEVAPCAQPAH